MRGFRRLLVIGLALLLTASCGTPTLRLTVAAKPGVLAFSPPVLSVPAGATVELTFNNTSEISHTMVLIDGNEATLQTVIAGAGAAGAAGDYIPVGFTGVIAHTALVGPGKSDIMLFSAPVATTYFFFCSYPKHLDAGMRGALEVENR